MNKNIDTNLVQQITTYELSQSQMGIYLEYIQYPELLQYNYPCYFKFSKQVDIHRLKRAIELVLNTYPIFRNRIIGHDGELRQYSDDNLYIEVLIEFAQVGIESEILKQFVRPFDLSEDVLTRFLLLETPESIYLAHDIHHIIMDGKTTDVIYHLIELAYQGEELPAEAMSFYEYTDYEIKSFETVEYKESSDYYKEKFQGFGMTKLPGELNNKPGLLHQKSSFVPKAKVDEACELNGIRPSWLFMSAFEIVLSRFSREDRVSYSTALHGRNLSPLRDTLGMFVKTAPVLAHLEGETKVIDYIQSHKEELNSIRSHDIYPFTHFCRELGIVPELTFGFQGRFIKDDIHFLNEDVVRVPMVERACSQKPVVVVYDNETDYEVRVQYIDCQYSSATIQSFSDSIAVCVDQMLELLESPLKDLSMISDIEYGALELLGKGQEMSYDPSDTIIGLFSKQVIENPEAVAVVYEDREYTYGELDELSTRLGLYLRDHGVGREQVVGVMIDRSEWMVIYPLSILKAGGAYMPLDMALPSDRLLYMVDEAGVSLILSEEGLVSSRIPAFQGDVIVTKDVLNLAKTEDLLENSSSLADMSVILYTSGSTGRPKGCILEQGNLLNFSHWYIKEYNITSSDRGIAYANFSFDAHMMDLYPLLFCGGCIHIIPSSLRMDMFLLNKYIEENNITIAFLTTQIGAQIVSMFENSSLRLLSVGGEQLPPLKKPSYSLVNIYGPTECTVCSSIHEVTKDFDNKRIGRPLANYQLYIVDQFLHMVPKGVAGELCVGGAGVSRGYLNRADLTSEKFIELNGSRIYRTGDLVCWNEDGDLEYLGRIDNQVKLRGLRIELGEIESVMSRYNGIQQAIVDVKEMGGLQSLCGYYTSEELIEEGDLRDYLLLSLADYMVPTTFMKLESFPLTSNGKVNRKILPVPEMKDEEIIVAETPLEDSLFTITKGMLGISTFGVTTNLISMGLTSMGAIKLSLLIQKELGLSLKTKDILSNPTIRKWTSYIQKEEQIKVYDTLDSYPLTGNQLGIYLDWEQHRSSLQYNVPWALKFTGVDVSALRTSLEKVLGAHPYIKTRLAVDNGEIVQLRRDEEPFNIQVTSLEEDPDSEYFQSLVRPFNLLNDELYRIEIYETNNHTYLFIDIHHIIYDGGSVDIVLHDLVKAYQGIEIEKETFTAYEYSLEYKEWLESKFYNDAEAYFDTLVDGVDSVLYPLSTITETDRTSKKQIFSVPRVSVQDMCKQLGVTENCFLVTAFMQVLHRLTSEDHIMITTLSNGRSSTNVSNTIGMFVQTLPIVSHLTEETMRAVMSQMQDQLLDTISHEKYPFTRLAERHMLKPNIMIAYQGGVVDETLYFNDNPVEQLELYLTTPKVPLDIDIVPHTDMYHITLEYDSGLYRQEDMLLLGRSFQSFIEALVTSSVEEQLSKIPLVSEFEYGDLLRLGNGGEISYKDTETFVDLFTKQVQLNPEKIAVVDEEGSITYGELDRMSDSLASVLVSKGVGTDQFVALMLPRCKEFIVCFLAVFKAGGAYIPLDNDYPNDRLLYMLEDSKAKVLLTTNSLFTEKQKSGDFSVENILYVDDFDFNNWDCSVNYSDASSLAYMIYTSGSTGQPKGVMIEHQSLRSFVAWFSRCIELHSDDRCAQHASFSFDASMDDLMTPLSVGAEIHILSSVLRHDMAGMYNYFMDHQITGASLSTQLGMEMLNEYELPLRFIVVGGEKLKSTKLSSTKVINTYGPTEFTVSATYHILDSEKSYANIPIGRPVPNSISAIVDKSGNLVPRGIAGELCLIGRQISRGYWERSELTMEKFVSCPFINGEKMYRTGDLARWNEEGELEYLGRIDNQIKLRGFRIELGEIETALLCHEGIQDAIVEVKEIGGVQHLCAYYTSHDTIEKDHLREYLSESLVDYMIPTAFVHLESFPLTPNGKVDRKALPMPNLQTEEIIAPETSLEKSFLAIAKTLLGNEEFGVTTNLISMGLTSMGAIKLSLLIQKELGLTLKTKDILSHPTIRKWTEYIQVEKEQIKVYERKENYPLIENQLGIYLDWEKHRDSLQYNVPMALKFTGIDVETLYMSLEKILDIHSYIKVRLEAKDGNIYQVRCDEDLVQIQVNKLATDPETEYFQSLVRPFNLLKENLYRIEIYETNHHTYLFMDIHHIIFDGISANILMRDLQLAYQNMEIENEKFTFYEYSLEYNEWKESEAYVESEAYFDELVKETESVLYPLSEVLETDGKSRRLSLSLPRAAIKEMCKDLSITENCFFVTSFMQILHRITRENNILITTVSNGRSSMHISNTIGMCVQTLPIVSRFTEITILDAMFQMQNQLLDTVSHEKYPFTRLSERHMLKPNIMIAYQGGISEEVLRFNDNPVEELELYLTTVKVPLSLNIIPLEDTYQLLLEYDSSLYSDEDMLRLGKSLESFTTSLSLVSPQQQISNIPLVSETEYKKLLSLGQGKKLAYNDSDTFVDLFRKQVALYPNKPAVVDEVGVISYLELDQMSDALAAILIEKGVSSDHFVAIMLPRQKEFLMSILAVFKSGGAYVPLDSEYPNERLLHVLNDSKADILLTTRSLIEEKNKNEDFTIGEHLFLDELDYKNNAVPINRSQPSSLAYMIYTSGSTGLPKGVMIEHKSLVSFIQSRHYFLGLNSDDRCAQHASFSFDASLDDLITPLSVGAEVHILPSSLRQDMEKMYHYFNEYKITGLTLNTQLGMEMLNQYDLPLRYLMVGGEKLKSIKPSLVKVINGYGPTEFTVCSSYHIVDPKREYSNIPIGRPVPNSISVIVDETGNLLPHGFTGELCLIGSQISRGYWQRSELTREKFVSCPFMEDEKMYRTGDLARWNEEGELEYLGRIDNQIKLRGFRIELGEIEAAIACYEDIQSSIVEIKEIGGTPHLCAYYISPEAIEKDLLREYLLKSLADYMVPTAFMQLESFPLTPNGKVDRKILPIPEIERNIEYVPPTNIIEKDICSVFSEILKMDKVGINDNFFEFGGTSMTAIKAIIQISTLDYKINYGDLFKLKTPYALANFIKNQGLADPQDKLDNAFDLSTYDYSGINKVLSENHHEDFWTDSDLHTHGTILLTGSTGYLGIHLLHYLLLNGESDIYCLVRSQSKITSINRLKSLMIYYFNDDWESHFDSRVKVLEGDITDDTLSETVKEISIDTIFNCAAIVKHYVTEDTIEKVNINGVSNLISLSQSKDALLIHISTYSIGGAVEKGSPNSFTEQDLYIGQVTDNEYIYTKFIAERIILQNIADGKLKAKIMRVGNLMGRESDGEFQINFSNNAFVNYLKSYKVLGVFPLNQMTNAVEVSPIDRVAEAVAVLATTPEKMIVFHPYNNYKINMAVIVKAFNDYGYKIDLTSEVDFSARISELLRHPDKAIYLQGLIHSGTLDENLSIVESDNNNTTRILYHLGFYWNPLNTDYIYKLIEMLDGLAFFEEYNFTKETENKSLFFM
ncbi:non-ribosomal peptide synthetase [Chryseobacterium nematophagum]|nr:non-ribosomal peptide synthetase [Chryseobacterium nematophagum]